MARFQPEEGDRFTAISGTPGSERGEAFENLIRGRLNADSDPDDCMVKMPDNLDVDQNTRKQLEALHRHVVEVSIERRSKAGRTRKESFLMLFARPAVIWS